MEHTHTFSGEFAAPINNFLALSLCSLTQLRQKDASHGDTQRDYNYKNSQDLLTIFILSNKSQRIFSCEIFFYFCVIKSAVLNTLREILFAQTRASMI